PSANQNALPYDVSLAAQSDSSVAAFFPPCESNGPGPADWVSAIVSSVTHHDPSAGAQLQLDLFSSDLGRIQLSVCVAKNQVSIHVLVGDEAAKQCVERRLELLQARLAEMGLALAHFDVEGAASGHSEQSDPEHCAHSAQMEINGLPKLSKTPA